MEKKKNFLLGYGERLTEKINPPKIKPTKVHPYNFEEAVKNLTPKVNKTVAIFNSLPDAACPGDEVVAIFTLHPAYLAKSYFPSSMFNFLGLRTVGSKPVKVKPIKWTKKGDPEDQLTIDVFVAGTRDAFNEFEELISDTDNISDEEQDFLSEIIKIENIRTFKKRERLRNIDKKKKLHKLEVALHLDPVHDESMVFNSFKSLTKSKGIKIDFKRRIYAKGLCFLPIEAPQDSLDTLDQFSFLRVAREIPKLRDFKEITRSLKEKIFPIKLPDLPPIDSSLRVAIFDGGIGNNSPFAKWAKEKQGGYSIGETHPSLIEHGSMVTSAFLFGPLANGTQIQQPVCKVDHYRVLDDGPSDEDLFDILNRIESVLSQNEYEFFNLSLGPRLPIEDDEVHVWTAKLDELLSDGKKFATIAVGNDGDLDKASGNARIQVPSDCVNAVAVGASDRDHINWRRATYSSIGPGRSPGVIKPDFVTFGGSRDDLFYVVDENNPSESKGTLGTSFAAPFALRMAAGIKAIYKTNLNPLAIKGLLIHHSTQGNEERTDVGWGKIPKDFDEIILCPDGSAKIVYQGYLEPAKFLRAKIPMLDPGELNGKIGIKATFCFATEVDPQDPSSYTRSGLEITFRPNQKKRKSQDQDHPDSKPFFSASNLYSHEHELRKDAHKWETVLHNQSTFLAASLDNPVFDIHYNSREFGQSTRNANKIPYSLIITVSAPKVENFYDKIVSRYQATLDVLQPEIELEIHTKVGSN